MYTGMQQIHSASGESPLQAPLKTCLVSTMVHVLYFNKALGA